MDISTTILFYLLAFTALTSTITLIYAQKAEIYLYSSIILFISISGIYFQLNASFNAIILLICSSLLMLILYCNKNFISKKEEKKKNKVETIMLSLFLLLFFMMIIIAILTNNPEQIHNNLYLAKPINQLITNHTFISEKFCLDYCIAFVSIQIILFISFIAFCSSFIKPNKEDN